MKKPSRYLITTSDERTWKFNQPVVFLGDWCLLYHRVELWSGLDYKIASPYGLSTKESDNFQARELERKLFPEVCKIMNKYHNINYSERQWKLILGSWLRRFIEVMINRTKSLINCMEEFNITGVKFYDSNRYSLATIDSYSAIWAFDDPRWNAELYRHIADELLNKNIPIDRISDVNHERYIINNVNQNTIYIVYYIKFILNYISIILTRKSDGFFITSYLPKCVELYLNIILKQFPNFRLSPKVDFDFRENNADRNNLSSIISSNSINEIDFNIRRLLFKALPICYLENFSKFTKHANKLLWPNNPKFIFTSNSYDMDEIFKFWAAKKIDEGATLILGQHGNNYGTLKYMNPTIEESVADYFITWGWQHDMDRHIPAFIFTKAGKKSKIYDPNGILLLIEEKLYRKIGTWDTHFEYKKYFSDQIKFVEKLGGLPREKLLIRFHALSEYMGWDEKKRWQAYNPLLSFDNGRTPLNKLIAKSRLVVHSYDSTGMLETLHQDIPTLAFWQNGLDHLCESALPHYKLLIDAGIVHLSPESLAQKVNEIWDDVDKWWGTSSIREARILFCDKYAKYSANPSHDLAKIINNLINSKKNQAY
jgi:putative transferase (TIGR04331 family)